MSLFKRNPETTTQPSERQVPALPPITQHRPDPMDYAPPRHRSRISTVAAQAADFVEGLEQRCRDLESDLAICRARCEILEEHNTNLFTELAELREANHRLNRENSAIFSRLSMIVENITQLSKPLTKEELNDPQAKTEAAIHEAVHGPVHEANEAEPREQPAVANVP